MNKTQLIECADSVREIFKELGSKREDTRKAIRETMKSNTVVAFPTEKKEDYPGKDDDEKLFELLSGESEGFTFMKEDGSDGHAFIEKVELGNEDDEVIVSGMESSDKGYEHVSVSLSEVENPEAVSLFLIAFGE